MRKKKGAWGIFGKERVFARSKEQLAKERLERMRQAKEQRGKEAKAAKKREQIALKTSLMASKAQYMEAKVRRKKAQKAASYQWPILPTAKVKIRKKKQGKKLSQKKRIGLI